MTAGEEIEEVLEATIAALPHLRMEDLQELERRMVAMATLHTAGSVAVTPALRRKVELLEAHLSMTGKNLRVLRRIVNREARTTWVV